MELDGPGVVITTTGGPEPDGVRVVVPGVGPGVYDVTVDGGAVELELDEPGVVMTTTGGPEPEGVRVVVPGVGPGV